MSRVMNHSITRVLLTLLVFALCFGVAGAQELSSVDLNTTAENSGKVVNSAGVVLQGVMAFLGLCMILIGAYQMYQANKEDGQGRAKYSTAIVAMVAGAFLFFGPLTVGTLGKTLFNTSARPATIQVIPN